MNSKNKILFSIIASSMLLITSCEDSSSSLISTTSSSNSSSTTPTSQTTSSTSASSEESSSSSSSSSIPVETFTVTWVNYDNTVLEEDLNVEYGTYPTYDGLMPIREDEEIDYVFNKWSPEISIVTENIIYKAVFINKEDLASLPGAIPVLSEDNKTITYGIYPQSYVSDVDLINSLDNSVALSNGMYFYDNTYYVKDIANTFNNEPYLFNDNVSITNGSEYYFKCEAISWDILSNDDNSYMLLSSVLLDAHEFNDSYDLQNINDNIIYPNNYEHSSIRSFLNNEFMNKAFVQGQNYIKDTLVINESSSTDSLDNIYSSNNTLDKVYLPSYRDFLNEEYGFEDVNGLSSTRRTITTDYARAKGAWCNDEKEYKNNGSFWTRSPSSNHSYAAYNVNSGGFLSEYGVDGDSYCVRPSITIFK